jgi:aminoglycoside phosphotransferase (APT) family kinase protein
MGLARPGDPSVWPGVLITTLTVGGHDYCRHRSLRHHDERTARLLSRIEDVGRGIVPHDLVGHDIVHWDLHPGNLLQQDGALSAVVDTDFAAVGDAAFDLVLLALASLTVPCEKGVRSRLFAAAFDDLGALQRRAYLSHYFLRLLDWSIRRGRQDEIEFWLARADQMLEG